MTDSNKRWEDFKSQVLLWKNAHTDEYFDFAEKMDKTDDKGFLAMAQFMNKQLPELMTAWKRRWRDDTTNDNMEELNDIVLRSDILKAWIGEVEANDADSLFNKGSKRNIGALTLCWIIYGQMFETVIRQYEKLRQSKHVGYFQKHIIIPLLVKRAIRASIKNGYRTQRDWEMYFKLAKAYREDVAVAETLWVEMKKGITDGGELAILEEAYIALRKANEDKAKLKEELATMQTQLNDTNTQGKTAGRKKAKSQPLADYLTCENKDEVIAIIRQHIEQNNSGIPIALTFVALQELGIISGITNNLEYYNALALQFPDFKDLRSESSCKHSIGDVQKTQKIYMDGRQCDGRLHEDDKYAPLYNTLVDKIRTALKAG